MCLIIVAVHLAGPPTVTEGQSVRGNEVHWRVQASEIDRVEERRDGMSVLHPIQWRLQEKGKDDQ